MYDFLVKKGTTVSFLVGVVLIALFLGSAISGLGSSGFDTSTDLVQVGKSQGFQDLNFFNVGLYATLFLIVLAIAAMVIFGLLGLIKFPKAGLRSILTFVGLIVLFFILKALAPADVTAKMTELKETFNITENVSGYIGGGIMTTLALIVIAALAMVFFEIRNAFK